MPFKRARGSQSQWKLLSPSKYPEQKALRSRKTFRAALSILARRNRSDFCDFRLRCPSRTPEIPRFPRHETAMMHCDLRVRWKVASDLRFRAAISEPKTPSFSGISGDLAPSTRRSLAIAIVRFWCAKLSMNLCQRLKHSHRSRGDLDGRGL